MASRISVVPPFGLRMPELLRSRLKELAEENHRSLNSEIIYHLERALFDRLSEPSLQSEASN